MTAAAWIGVGLLGAAGALARFHLDSFVQRRAAGELPVGTLVVNLTGAFLLGLLTGLSVASDAMLVLGTGLLGSFTTFSTWMLETERLAEDDASRVALANLVVSLGAGLAAAAAGWALGAVL